MIFKLFARKPADEAIDRLYGQIMAAARRPELFLDGYAVADTLDGRFDLVLLHAFMALRRLNALEAPGPEMAQQLADRIFLGFDRALREMGVGDLAVPKRIKKMAADYSGRSNAYAAALGESDPAARQAALQIALARNVYAAADPAPAARLARYVLAATAALDERPLAVFAGGTLPFPDPAAIT